MTTAQERMMRFLTGDPCPYGTPTGHIEELGEARARANPTPADYSRWKKRRQYRDYSNDRIETEFRRWLSNIPPQPRKKVA